MNDLRVQLTSWPELNDLVAEIWRGDQYVADVKVDGTLLSLRSAPRMKVYLFKLTSTIYNAPSIKRVGVCSSDEIGDGRIASLVIPLVVLGVNRHALDLL